MLKPHFLAFAALVLVAPPRSVAQQMDNAVAFINVNVVPMDRERILADQTVVVRGGLVIEMGPAETWHRCQCLRFPRQEAG